MTTPLVGIAKSLAAALSSEICNLTPYPSRQPTEGGRYFVGALEFTDGPLDTSSARRKAAGFNVTAHLKPSLGENEYAEELLMRLCHGELSWFQRLRASNIVGVRPLDSGLDISRTIDSDGTLTITVSATIIVEVAAIVEPTAT